MDSLPSFTIHGSNRCHYSLPFSSPIHKATTQFKSKSKWNKKIQLIIRSSVTCGKYPSHYGGWDDLGSSNSSSVSVWDWLKNWENDRQKSLLVMGFGFVFAWSVARFRALWWLCFPLSGFLFFVFFHDYISTSPRNSKNSSSVHDAIRMRVVMVSDVILKVLSLDKSALENLPMQNGVSFGEFLPSLKTVKRTFPKFTRSPRPESSAKEVNLDPEIWKRIFEEDDPAGRGPHPQHVAGAEDMIVGKNEAHRESRELGKKDLTTNEFVGIAETMDSSSLNAGDTRKIDGISTECSSDTFSLGYSQQSTVPELGQDKSKRSDHFQDREIDTAESVRSRKGESDGGNKWRKQISITNLDECAIEEQCSTNYGYDGEQLPDKNGSVFQQWGRSEVLDSKGKQSSPDSRRIISRSAEQMDEEYGLKDLKGPDLSQNDTRKSHALIDCVDATWQCRGVNQTVENPLRSAAAENEEMLKEQGLLKTSMSSSICPDKSNVFQNSLHLSESSEFEEPRSSKNGHRHGSRGNSHDRHGEVDNVKVNGTPIVDTNADCHPQPGVNRIKVVANSSQLEHSESSKAQNVLSSSENLKEKNFQMCLDKGGVLLKEAKRGLRGKAEVGDAGTMLYEAADLFSTAVAIDPSSLVAVGQLGNTLLIHGELKLKLSQELRSFLKLKDESLLPKMGHQYEPNVLSLDMMEREAVAATLHDVCEECEKLLVEAGRKYRTALMLDRYDVRSLYNWGLALCFRAQLIAGVGERALETADKIYLAAIDKFEAMMGISQIYAPDALFSWGLALRNRSRIRPMGNKEKTRLLQQARQHFQDALKFNPNHSQARTAAMSCIDELKEVDYVLLQTHRQGRRRS